MNVVNDTASEASATPTSSSVPVNTRPRPRRAAIAKSSTALTAAPRNDPAGSAHTTRDAREEHPGVAPRPQEPPARQPPHDAGREAAVNRQDGAERSSRRDAENSGVGQRIAEQALKRRACEPEAAAHDEARERARKA